VLLSELHNRLAPSFPPSVQKDLQTAVRVLAQALAYSDPQHCPLDQSNQPLSSLVLTVETHLRSLGKSPHTIRNTKNNLRRLFRMAAQEQVFSLAPASLKRRPYRSSLGIRPGTPLVHAPSLPYHCWPADVQKEYEAFVTWATAPVVPGRSASLTKRPTTIAGYRKSLESYFGYLSRVREMSTFSFDMLFDYSLVSAYVFWHVNECHQRMTRSIENFLIRLLAMTNQYRRLPEFHAQVRQLKRELPTAHPVYRKEDAWVPLKELARIADDLWPKKQLDHLQTKKSRTHRGTNTALYAGLSLLFHLWTYRPYRQRNIREMKLGDNLYQDAQGRWRIRFQGEQLKIAMKRGQPNIFDLPFPEDLVPRLEEYLTHWHPLLLAKAHLPDSYVFLTRRGHPYRRDTLNLVTKLIVYRYTGKYWHPHIIRSVWATEYIRNTHGDFYTAAIMLNDTLETVIKNYAYLLEEDVAEKADRLIKERNGQGR
jgi:hypothetical protein